MYQPFVHAEILSEMTNLPYKIHFVGNESTRLQTATGCPPVVRRVPLHFAHCIWGTTGGVRASIASTADTRGVWASMASLADQFTLVVLLAFLPISFLVGAWVLIYSL